MEPNPLPFASLYLLDHRTGAPATKVPVLFQTTVGCFAANLDTPSDFVPGYLTVNFYLKTSTFSDFEASARAKRLGILLRLPLLAGAVGTLAIVVAFILEMDAPVWSEGLWENGLFRLGLTALASAIALAALILAIGGRSKAAGWRTRIEIPEPILSELCEKYQSLQNTIKTFSEDNAKTSSFNDELKMSFAKSTAENIAGSIMPTGLAKLAVHMATESENSGDHVESIDHLKFQAIKEIQKHMQYEHEMLTGRNALTIPFSDFQNFTRITESELLSLADSLS